MDHSRGQIYHIIDIRKNRISISHVYVRCKHGPILSTFVFNLHDWMFVHWILIVLSYTIDSKWTRCSRSIESIQFGHQAKH